MNKKKPIKLLIILALFLSFILVVVQTIEYFNSIPKDGARCSLVKQGEIPRADSELIWSQNNNLVYFKASTGELILTETSSDLLAGFREKEIAKISLICPAGSAPSYHCFSSTFFSSGNPEILFFDAPYGLLQISAKTAGNKTLLVPFWWDAANTLKLGSPLGLCPTSKEPIWQQAKLIEGSLFVPEPRFASIYRYDLGTLTGFIPQAVSIPPQSVLYVNQQHQVVPVKCDQVKTEPREYAILKNRNILHILKENPDAAKLLEFTAGREKAFSYQWSMQTLIPLEAPPILDSTKFESAGAQKSETFVGNRSAIETSRGKWFSKLEVALVELNKNQLVKTSLESFDRGLLRNDKDRSFLQPIHESAFTVFSQRHDDAAKWAIFSCPLK